MFHLMEEKTITPSLNSEVQRAEQDERLEAW